MIVQQSPIGRTRHCGNAIRRVDSMQHVVAADFTAGRPKPHPHRRPRTRDRPYTVGLHHGPSIELKTRLCNELTSGLYRAPFSVVPPPVLKPNSRTPFSDHARAVWCTAVNGRHQYKKCNKKRVNLSNRTIMQYKVIHKATRTLED